MNRFVRYRRSASILGALLLTAGLLGTVRVSRARQEEDSGEHQRKENQEKYLFVWAGDQSRSSPDFLSVINFDERSSHYGEVLRTVPLPEPGARGNEPHHVGLSKDGKVLATGGLLSVLKGQPEIFFFDVSEPEEAKYIASVNPPLSSITDDFEPLADGGFLVTMMGGPQGHAPGPVVEFSHDLKLVSEYPANPLNHGFNPHGILCARTST